MAPYGPLDFMKEGMRKLQLKTIGGSVVTISGDAYNDCAFQAFENSFPGLKSFPEHDVEVLERPYQYILRVKIHGHDQDIVSEGWL